MIFYMLGNWSPGDYGKREAIEMALDLLLNVFNLDLSTLRVTVFAGDSELGLPADEVAVHEWLRVGIPLEIRARRVIVDHMRAVLLTSLAGVLPGRDGSSSVARCLVRRASRQARILGINKPFLIIPHSSRRLNTAAALLHQLFIQNLQSVRVLTVPYSHVITRLTRTR